MTAIYTALFFSTSYVLYQFHCSDLEGIPLSSFIALIYSQLFYAAHCINFFPLFAVILSVIYLYL